MKIVDVPVTRAVLGLGGRTDVTARAPGAIAADGTWLRTSDGAGIGAPKAHDTLPTARKPGLVGHESAPIADLSRLGRRIKGTVVRTIDADPAMLVETEQRRKRHAFWVCGDAAWPITEDTLRPQMRLEVIAPETALGLDPSSGAHVFFADGREGATFALPAWLAAALRWDHDYARYVWGLPDDAIVAMSVENGVAWIPIPALLEATSADRVRWTARTVFPTGGDANTTGDVLFASENMTLVASGTDRILIKVPTGCAKGERVRLVGRTLSVGPPQYMFLVRADGTRVACTSSVAPPEPETTTVQR